MKLSAGILCLASEDPWAQELDDDDWELSAMAELEAQESAAIHEWEEETDDAASDTG